MSSTERQSRLLLSALLLALALLLWGCESTGSRVRISAPTLATIGEKVSSAKAHVETAKAGTEEVIEMVAQPDKDFMEMALKLAVVKQALIEAEIELVAAHDEQGEAQQKLDEMAKDYAQSVERLNYLEPKYSRAVRLLWKWRWIAIGALLGGIVIGYLLCTFRRLFGWFLVGFFFISSPQIAGAQSIHSSLLAMSPLEEKEAPVYHPKQVRRALPQKAPAHQKTRPLAPKKQVAKPSAGAASTKASSPLRASWLRLLRQQVGVKEVPPGSNRGKRVMMYLRACDIRVPAPWCSAVLVWAADEVGMKRPQKLPGLASQWFPRSKRIRRDDVRPGDLGGVYFRSKGRIAHVMAVEKVRRREVVTLEGNTNAQGSREGHQFARRIRQKDRLTYARW